MISVARHVAVSEGCLGAVGNVQYRLITWTVAFDKLLIL